MQMHVRLFRGPFEEAVGRGQRSGSPEEREGRQESAAPAPQVSVFVLLY